jgi:ABC-type multidrug transport system fused ATPase/permease subunit
MPTADTVMPLATPPETMVQLAWLGWAVAYAVVGGLVGIFMVILASTFLPRLINRFTPALDEEKEIARGNQAVAEYFGRVVAAAIIGASVVIAAAVAAGVIAALHGV